MFFQSKILKKKNIFLISATILISLALALILTQYSVFRGTNIHKYQIEFSRSQDFYKTYFGINAIQAPEVWDTSSALFHQKLNEGIVLNINKDSNIEYIIPTKFMPISLIVVTDRKGEDLKKIENNINNLLKKSIKYIEEDYLEIIRGLFQINLANAKKRLEYYEEEKESKKLFGENMINDRILINNYQNIISELSNKVLEDKTHIYNYKLKLIESTNNKKRIDLLIYLTFLFGGLILIFGYLQIKIKLIKN